ncbi:MerR family transcriptional regulator [Candidatus Methylacidithermus pantelleriae]|uniref:Mercuric resistance operon regulatory protein n=1 Tax=Candidatus Methylacidithermus pantelleriae TaxID=2744239 RepID=A0A8J2BSW5_9BACT|nr:MerR family transcriptional regulator [Candidatus Methylacidithermus pantelleriae]CAF0697823.1 Mercuric resistance operon regulatory protein [Candidatus Methylacidithermus pantelleriae]
MKIGQLAQASGVGVETIRFYERKGLLRRPPKPYGGIRHYDSRHLERLSFIKRAQRLGFKLEEIRVLLQLAEGMECRKAQRIATDKLKEVQDRLNDLSRIASALQSLLSRCQEKRESVACPLLLSLLGAPSKDAKD